MDGLQSFNQDNVDVLFRDEDGYINLTALCKQAGKEFKAYHRIDTTKAFLKELSRSVNIPTDLLIQSVKSGPNELRGTWGHPQVAINLGQWISPQYAVSVTEIVMGHHKGIQVPTKQLPQQATEIEATASIFKSFHNIGTLAGFRGNQLTLSANLATRKLTSIDSLELMELTHLPVEVQEALLIPKQIGERLGGLSSIKVNKMLEELGLQVQTSYVGKGNIVKKFWELTKEGKQQAIYVDTSRKHSDGTPIRSIKWYESVIELLKGKAKQ